MYSACLQDVRSCPTISCNALTHTLLRQHCCVDKSKRLLTPWGKTLSWLTIGILRNLSVSVKIKTCQFCGLYNCNTGTQKSIKLFSLVHGYQTIPMNTLVSQPYSTWHYQLKNLPSMLSTSLSLEGIKWSNLPWNILPSNSSSAFTACSGKTNVMKA